MDITSNKSIRILYIVNHAVMYGANKSLLLSIEGLIKKGIVPYVVLGNRDGLYNELQNRGISCSVIPHGFRVYPQCEKSFFGLFRTVIRLAKSIILNIIATKLLISIVRQFSPDIIHTNIGPDYLGYKVAKKLKIPHVWHIREYQNSVGIKAFPSKNIYIRTLRYKNNYKIAITHSLYNYFKLDERSVVIYNGVLSKDKAQYSKYKEKYFLFVGRFEENKGVKNLLFAFIEFAGYNKDYVLKIVGDGEESDVEFLKQIVERKGLRDRVSFLGFRDDVDDLMLKATALIVPSISEGFGRITAEAMYNGCLAIGFNSTGTKEILEENNLGILYLNSMELIEQMKLVAYKGIEEYTEMILKAQRYAITHFSQEQNVESIFKFYYKILNEEEK